MTSPASPTTINEKALEEGGVNHFAEAHGGPRPNLLKMIDKRFSSFSGREHVSEKIHSGRAPVHWRHLFKRPVIRQWVHDGKLYREEANREAAKTELFFDLMFAGIIHQLADGASESATGINMAKFVLIFYPAWSVWTDVKTFINTSGTDDVIMRTYTFFIMCLLLGYSANATSIKIEKPGETSSDGSATVTARSIATLFVRSLFSRQDDTTVSSGEATGTTDVAPNTFDGGYAFTEGFQSALPAAIGFFLSAKLIRIFFFLIYGYVLPKFRRAHYLQAAAVAFNACIYLPLIWVTSPSWVVGLFSAGIITELSNRYVVGLYTIFIQKQRFKSGKDSWYVPALNIEHAMERMGLFVLLVIGESIINVSFTPMVGSTQYGPHTEYWRALFGLSISFSLCWIYFDADSSRVFIHALRRHWFTGITYSHIHWPFCASLILMSAGLARMVAQPYFENVGYRWMFSGSLGFSVFCLAIMGFLHKNLDKPGSSRIPRSIRLCARFVTALIITLLPLSSVLNDTLFTLAISACALAAQSTFEMFGKLGAIGAGWEDLHHEDGDVEQQLPEQPQEPLGEAQADPNFEVDVVGPSQTEDEVREGVIRTSAEERRRNAISDEIVLDEKHGRLSLPQTPYNTEGGAVGRKTKVVLPTRQATALSARRMADRKEKAERWEKEREQLTETEKGEDDVGMAQEIGKIEVREINRNQRWAYVA
ncbi:hypothetical protein FRB97_004423 [Tulasnella sp. 331]|nr:hypothetical protein FRB97_004423 [Tulasnella sp. 331]KAG8881722.1 hypothetical protein FRB98_004184 [Tulasnella sp. 332]